MIGAIVLKTVILGESWVGDDLTIMVEFIPTELQPKWQ